MNKKISKPIILSPEEQKIKHEKWLDDCPFVPNKDEFNYTSLISWLNFCEIKGINHIPGEIIDTIEVQLLWDAIDGKANEKTKLFFQKAENYLEKNSNNMIRWDCCASYVLKYSMGNSGESKLSDRGIILDDPRFFDIIFEWRSEKISIIGRPWVKALYYKKWPVEFRVYVQDNEIIGVSNYYPQRDLSEEFLLFAEGCKDITENLHFPVKIFYCRFFNHITK